MASPFFCFSKISFLILLFSFRYCSCIVPTFDYGSALTKSLLYFEASRSGSLPYNSRVLWRDSSALNDGKSEGVDLVGGYYVTGDNVKYGFPMAFAITMLSWSVVEFGSKLEAAGELSNALDAIKWGTDYFLKGHTEPNVFYGQVGKETSDRACWERPEDMDTPRNAYKIDEKHTGADLAAETAAALAAASIAFRIKDPSYSSRLLTHAMQLYNFSLNYDQEWYQKSIPVITDLYQSSDYEDEQIWASVWLYLATNDTKYMDYLNTIYTLDAGPNPFNWNTKYPGAYILIGKLQLRGKLESNVNFTLLRGKGESYICNCLGSGGPSSWKKTNGGLLYKQSSSNLDAVTPATFLMVLYAEALFSSGLTLRCSNQSYTPPDLITFAKSQVDYILGKNPKNTSYMVGFGPTYPQQVHHRGASIISVKWNRTVVGCQDGFALWEKRDSPNPNVLDGAIVGGPNIDDAFDDRRDNKDQTEPTLTTVAPFVGILAYFS